MLTFCRCECGAVVSVWNESEMKCRFWGTKNRNGMQLEWSILTKSTGINNQFMFRFRHNWWVVGNFCGYLFIITYGVNTSQEGDKCRWWGWKDCGRWRNECSERSVLEWNGRLRSVAERMDERRAMRGADADAWTNELEWSVEGRNTEWKWSSECIGKKHM